jgi:hypothetical protein
VFSLSFWPDKVADLTPPATLPRFHLASAIQLYFEEQYHLAAQAVSKGQKHDLHVCNLVCNLRFPGCKTSFAGKIDEAAYITVFPRPCWRQMTGANIEWLKLPASAPPCWSSVAGISGARIPCRLGAVWAFAVDYQMRCLPAARIIGLFVQGDIHEDRILLGLTHGILDDRFLVSKSHPDAALRHAWLTTQPALQPPVVSVS